MISKISKLILNLISINPVTRYEARYEWLKWFVNSCGFRLYNKNLIWMSDRNIKSLKKEFPADTGKYIHERKFNLYYLAQSVQKIKGNTAECGAYKGEGSFYILRAQNNTKKMHHIFDSFSGLSKPNEQLDGVQEATSYSWVENDLSIPLEDIKNNLNGFDNIVYHKGWIPEKFMEVNDETFSFVHIDVDLFQPTYDSLEYFYGMMSVGGIILCDDYGSTLCPGAKKAFDKFAGDKPENIVRLTTGQGFIVKQ